MENKFREFIIAGTYMSVALQDGGLQKFFVACSKIQNTLITGDHVHTIEIAAVEQLKAENLELDIQIARMDKALCSRDRKIKQLQEELEELQKTYDMESGGKY